MRLNGKNLTKAYHDAIISQYEDKLRKEGYTIERDKVFMQNGYSFIPDLFAYNKSEKRVYEFKVIGAKTAPYDKSIEKLKEFSNALGAKFFIIYVNPPHEKSIEIEGLNETLIGYFASAETPQALDELSTHTYIDSIDLEEIESVDISKESISVKGTALIQVILQYGSASDDGIETSEDFPMTFEVVLDHELNIIDIEYEIDTSEWYETME